jgi:hypothetical protein
LWVWGLAGVLLLGAAGEIYENQWRIPAALEAGDYEEAGESLGRLAWIARDSASGPSPHYS